MNTIVLYAKFMRNDGAPCSVDAAIVYNESLIVLKVVRLLSGCVRHIDIRFGVQVQVRLSCGCSLKVLVNMIVYRMKHVFLWVCR